jgi:hypothetical protein
VALTRGRPVQKMPCVQHVWLFPGRARSQMLEVL